MMTLEQLHTLRADRQYKKTRGWYFNWKFSKSLSGAPNISVFDMNMGEKPYQQINIIGKIGFWLSKRCSISKEIGEFRNDIIERILNPSLGDDFPISDLIRSNMIWVKADETKLECIRKLTVEFVSSLKILQIIFKVINVEDIDEQKKFMDQFIEKINIIFYKEIEKLMEGVAVKSKEDFKRFQRTHAKYLVDDMEKRQRCGNLTGDLTSNKTGGE